MSELQKDITVRTLAKMKKNNQKIVMITAYDTLMAQWAEKAGCPMILVGDSMGNTVLGYKNTIPVSLEESLILTAAVCRGREHAFVVGDMPFMSYQISDAEAIRNAGRYIKETGANAIKLEGGAGVAHTIKALVNASIPVMAHIGLMPQSVLKDGGYHIHGKDDKEAEQIKKDALAVQEAGAFSVVLEGIPADLSKEISEMLDIFTIGIAAGPDCDGQVQVITDVLSMGGAFIPKHAKVYAEIGKIATEALQQYCKEVEEGIFPK
ncbi:MAG: 3-methyl-2-oxobutanoate hydroxymethyltransferase [Lentisphaeria bacterium]